MWSGPSNHLGHFEKGGGGGVQVADVRPRCDPQIGLYCLPISRVGLLFRCNREGAHGRRHFRWSRLGHNGPRPCGPCKTTAFCARNSPPDPRPLARATAGGAQGKGVMARPAEGPEGAWVCPRKDKAPLPPLWRPSLPRLPRPPEPPGTALQHRFPPPGASSLRRLRRSPPPGMHWKGGSPPPGRPDYATVSPTPSAGFTGIGNRQ